ncbi:MAG: histidine kinase dimerization/phospho-acceptor domain-containing protein [Merdibacter sp.]
MRRDLIANVSHDLRTPLTMISGYGEMMRDLPGENTPENVQVTRRRTSCNLSTICWTCRSCRRIKSSCIQD